jgi:hypothetical protein
MESSDQTIVCYVYWPGSCREESVLEQCYVLCRAQAMLVYYPYHCYGSNNNPVPSPRPIVLLYCFSTVNLVFWKPSTGFNCRINGAVGNN